MNTLSNKIFYMLKPLLPRKFQIFCRRKIAFKKLLNCKDIWPIDYSAGILPHNWDGWPGNKQFALVLTHDVETAKGQDKCLKLMELEQTLGFRSSFNFVPKRYQVSSELRQYLVSNGFEVGVHGLYHDGKYYVSRKIFQERAVEINSYLKEWKSVGFRSPSMHYNLDWIHDLNIKYDSSTFDTDPFEPFARGMKTIFPFWVSKNSNSEGYIELPYTLPQDFTLFVIMKEKNIDIWKKKLDWIIENRGMVLFNAHPDYMNFEGKNLGIEEYPASYYIELLNYIKQRYKGMYWHVLPREIAEFWRKNMVNSFDKGVLGKQ